MQSERAYCFKLTMPVSVLSVVMTILTGVNITTLVVFALSFFLVYWIGCNSYHRYWSHHQFEMTRFGQVLTAMLGLFAMVGDPLSYARTHRQHHAYSDTDKDPHSPTHGRVHAMVGWLFSSRAPIGVFVIRDLLVEKYAFLRVVANGQIQIVWSTLIAIASVNLHALTGVLWCMVLSFTLEMLVNAFAHSKNGGAIDRKVFAWMSLASYHAQHHKNPSTLHRGDPGWLIVPLLKRL